MNIAKTYSPPLTSTITQAGKSISQSAAQNTDGNAIDQVITQRSVESGANVVRTASKMLGSIIDILA